MKKLNLRIPALLLVVILIMAFAIPAFAANSSDAAAATTAVESAGGLSDTAAKALGAAIAIGLAAAGGAWALLPVSPLRALPVSPKHRIRSVLP